MADPVSCKERTEFNLGGTAESKLSVPWAEGFFDCKGNRGYIIPYPGERA